MAGPRARAIAARWKQELGEHGTPETYERVSQEMLLEPEAAMLVHTDFKQVGFPEFWTPLPGPQSEAYHSDVDMLLYGGAAGGGKSDLLLGWALTKAQRSVIFRQQTVDITGLTDRLLEMTGDARHWNDQKKRYARGSKLLEFGHLEKPRSEYGWQGRAHDFIGFDEAAQIAPHKIHFVLGWLRSATGRKCRTILASNPPIGGQGDYLVEWFAPWLDPLFPEPATPGEVRWCVVKSDGTPIWVDGPGLYEVPGAPEPVPSQSRTFIPSLLKDNPYLANTGYRAKILNMPEPLRTALLTGDFLAAREDHDHQVVPTDWVRAAQDRWRKFHERGSRPPEMLCLGVDVAQGGSDRSVMVPVHDDYVAEPIILPGKETHSGDILASHIVNNRRNFATIIVDLGGGWGGSTRDFLKEHHGLHCVQFIGASKSVARQHNGGMPFANKRAEAFWRIRELLDPSAGATLMLPPSKELEAELTAIRWIEKSGKIGIEPKDEQIKRLGRSPDIADALAMALWGRREAALIKANNAMNAGRKIAGAKINEDVYDPFSEL